MELIRYSFCDIHAWWNDFVIDDKAKLSRNAKFFFNIVLYKFDCTTLLISFNSLRYLMCGQRGFYPLKIVTLNSFMKLSNTKHCWPIAQNRSAYWYLIYWSKCQRSAPCSHIEFKIFSSAQIWQKGNSNNLRCSNLTFPSSLDCLNVTTALPKFKFAGSRRPLQGYRL